MLTEDQSVRKIIYLLAAIIAILFIILLLLTQAPATALTAANSLRSPFVKHWRVSVILDERSLPAPANDVRRERVEQ
jgi:hypothetical protein